MGRRKRKRPLVPHVPLWSEDVFDSSKPAEDALRALESWTPPPPPPSSRAPRRRPRVRRRRRAPRWRLALLVIGLCAAAWAGHAALTSEPPDAPAVSVASRS